jgi:hypothetical protein
VVFLGLEVRVAQGAGGVNEAEDIGRPGLEHLLEGFVPVLLEGGEDLKGGNEAAGGLDFGGIGAGFLEQFGGVFDLETVVFELFLVFEPVLIAAMLPVGEVLKVEAFTGFAQFVNDDVVGEAVVQHAVDQVAGGLGKAGDFAAASVRIGELRFIYEGFDEGSWGVHGGVDPPSLCFGAAGG